MNRDDARDEIRARCADYLREAFGVDARSKKKFLCVNPAHADHTPSMEFDARRNKAHCFSCGADYDTFDLVAIKEGLSDHADIFRRAYEAFGVTIDGQGDSSLQARPQRTGPRKGALDMDATRAEERADKQDDTQNYLAECAGRVGETDYFTRRGLSQEIITRFKLGYDPNFCNKSTGYKVWSAAIIPTGGGSFVARNMDPTATSENRYRKHGASQLLNADALDVEQVVFVCEGELDALSVVEAGAAAVGLGSASNAKKFIEHVKERRPKAFIVLTLDNDQTGEETTEQLHGELDALGIPHAVDSLSGVFKDQSEALQRDRGFFLQAVRDSALEHELEREQAAQNVKNEYITQNSTLAYINDFLDGIKARASTTAIPTGFKHLDEILDGGLYEGLYTIGAISSLGKTAFALQVADYIATAGHDVLIYSLEMARTELMARSISRLTAEIEVARGALCMAKTTRGILAGNRYSGYSAEERALINSAVERYRDSIAKRLYINEGMGDITGSTIEAGVERHIQATGNVPVVIIDYLQLIASEGARASDKRVVVDETVFNLKRLSRTCKIPVIAISSVNRASYKDSINMAAFKETGLIEFSSDVLIGLQLQGINRDNIEEVINAAKRKEPRDIELVILKNRNGRTGDKLEFCYYARYNLFKERISH